MLYSGRYKDRLFPLTISKTKGVKQKILNAFLVSIDLYLF